VNEPHPDIINLTDAFRRVARERMQGLPIVNPALEVEAVDFREWEGRWLGVLIAPWFMNLVLLPAEGEHELGPAPGVKQILKLPSGKYEFTAARLDPVGSYQSCALFSSVLNVPDQRTAREVAQAVMQALFEEAPGSTQGKLSQPVSRRDLLRRALNGD
jgi:[NiFe] hydrogenase assembly HybE family chaperone